MNEAAPALARPVWAYLLYRASKITFVHLLLLWAFVASALTNSILTGIQLTYANFPELIAPTWNTYVAFYYSVLCTGALHIIASRGGRIYVDKYVGFMIFYICTSVFSLFVNREEIPTREPIWALIRVVFPFVIALFYIQGLNRSHVRSVGKVFVAFALLNVLASYMEMYINRDDITFSHISAIFSDRNLLARFLSIAHAFILIDFLSRARKRLVSLPVLSMLMIFICVTFLLSRSGYVMYLFASFFILFQIQNKIVRRLMPWILLLVLCLFGFMIGVRMLKDKMNIWPSSDIGRIATIRTGFNMIAESPVYGIGYGMGKERYIEFQDKHFPGLRDISTIHNIYINVLAEQGILGFTAYMLLNFGLLLALYRRMRGRALSTARAELFCFVGLAIYMLHGIVYHSMDYEGVYWIMVALSVITLRDASERRGRGDGTITRSGDPVW